MERLRLLDPSPVGVERERLVHLGADARVGIPARARNGKRPGREQRIVERDLGGERRRESGRGDVVVFRLLANARETGGEPGRRGHEHQDPPGPRPGHEEDRDRKGDPEHPTQRAELGNADVARPEQCRHAGRKEQAPRDEREDESDDAEACGPPQPQDSARDRDPGFRRVSVYAPHRFGARRAPGVRARARPARDVAPSSAASSRPPRSRAPRTTTPSPRRSRGGREAGPSPR